MEELWFRHDYNLPLTIEYCPNLRVLDFGWGRISRYSQSLNFENSHKLERLVMNIYYGYDLDLAHTNLKYMEIYIARNKHYLENRYIKFSYPKGCHVYYEDPG